MAANPAVVITTIDVPWDGGTARVMAGQVVDIPPGSALEAAYGGSSNLVRPDASSVQSLSVGSGPGS